ncbi:hypothetical protein CPC735_001380 [Coccidioides posadasii C735 delta SOWgp]|uniref:Uncharacterized protein n=1 Tax=Coccidioides posadasii (strain C735) TaxID=222929 RepID=C5PE60_COCP7|nr:hypothetical protein CPC735_001380 [Coccidioides posadasii C735 delta SOWgp]EER24793.1 hypothetical protein CPC735_001380 [Coccidioides posadasii C735 delta SOWgp]|eukprot:XP_003066938.1 hypothetical protein CPC735_001380 [Coccidioides posadasii C735 delta SOWgp]
MMIAVLPVGPLFGHVTPEAKRTRRSFPVLARTESEPVSAALVALIILAAFMVFGLFVGLFRIGRRHKRTRDSHNAGPEKLERGLGTRATIPTPVENLRSRTGPPLLEGPHAPGHMNGYPPMQVNPEHFPRPPPEVTDHAVISSHSPFPRSHIQNLDLDVVTIGNESIDDSASQSLASAVTSSVSSIIEKYRHMPEDSVYDSEDSARTARPRRKQVNARNYHRSPNTGDSPYTMFNYTWDDTPGQRHTESPAPGNRLHSPVRLNLARPMSPQTRHQERLGSHETLPNFTANRNEPDEHLGIDSTNHTHHTHQTSLPASCALHKGKFPMRQDSMQVPPLSIRKMPSAPMATTEDTPRVLSSSSNGRGRPERTGGYGGFLQIGPQTRGRPAERGNVAYFNISNSSNTDRPGSSKNREHILSNQDFPRRSPYTGQEISLQKAAILEYLQVKNTPSEGNVDEKTIRFPLQATSTISDQSPGSSNPLSPAVTPNEQIEFRDSTNGSYPFIHKQAREVLESVHLGLAPPRESANFEWEEKRRPPASDIEPTQDVQAASSSQGRSGNDLSPDSSDVLEGSLSSSSGTSAAGNRGDSRRKKKRQSRLHNLVRKFLY